MSFEFKIAPRRNPSPEEAAYDAANTAYRNAAAQIERVHRRTDEVARALIEAAEAPGHDINPDAENYRRAYDDAVAADTRLAQLLREREICYHAMVRARGY